MTSFPKNLFASSRLLRLILVVTLILSILIIHSFNLIKTNSVRDLLISNEITNTTLRDDEYTTNLTKSNITNTRDINKTSLMDKQNCVMNDVTCSPLQLLRSVAKFKPVAKGNYVYNNSATMRKRKMNEQAYDTRNAKRLATVSAQVRNCAKKDGENNVLCAIPHTVRNYKPLEYLPGFRNPCVCISDDKKSQGPHVQLEVRNLFSFVTDLSKILRFKKSNTNARYDVVFVRNIKVDFDIKIIGIPYANPKRNNVYETPSALVSVFVCPINKTLIRKILFGKNVGKRPMWSCNQALANNICFCHS